MEKCLALFIGSMSVGSRDNFSEPQYMYAWNTVWQPQDIRRLSWAWSTARAATVSQSIEMPFWARLSSVVSRPASPSECFYASSVCGDTVGCADCVEFHGGY